MIALFALLVALKLFLFGRAQRKPNTSSSSQYAETKSASSPGDAQEASSTHSTSPITQLPTEILLQINSLLPLASQACLALSCRSFFETVGSVLRAKEFRFPRIVYDERSRWMVDKPMICKV